MMKFPLFPESASTVAGRVDALFFALLGVCGFVLVGIAVVIVFFLFRYRRGKQVSRGQWKFSTVPFEMAWTIVPLLAFVGFFVWGADLYLDIQKVPTDGLDVQVVGKQWMWKVQHPTGQREINELHVPLGRNVRLTLASQDVIHSFFIPAFRIKQDLVPGRYTTAWFNATEPGAYHLFCAEYCGKDHSRMGGWIYVLSPGDYENWLSQGRPAESGVATGARLFRELGCSGCHMGKGVVRAPTLEGLFGKPVPLMSGDVVVADDRYIHDSILFPGREITAGYEPLMPSYEGRVSEEEIFDLVTYIKTLANQNALGTGDLLR